MSLLLLDAPLPYLYDSLYSPGLPLVYPPIVVGSNQHWQSWAHSPAPASCECRGCWELSMAVVVPARGMTNHQFFTMVEAWSPAGAGWCQPEPQAEPVDRWTGIIVTLGGTNSWLFLAGGPGRRDMPMLWWESCSWPSWDSMVVSQLLIISLAMGVRYQAINTLLESRSVDHSKKHKSSIMLISTHYKTIIVRGITCWWWPPLGNAVNRERVHFAWPLLGHKQSFQMIQAD